jgi:quinol monooxygenase YgiN
MTKVGLLIKFTAKDGQRDALAAHLGGLTPIAQSEAGTELWTVHASPTEPNAVWLYEVYSSPQALEAHNATPANAAAKARTGELTDGPPQVFPLIPMAGKGLL